MIGYIFLGIMCCQAVYDYEATCDEELTFFEGQIIRILKKVVCDVDDGWWEGEIDGQVGLFPSLVVEELKENGEPLTPMTPMVGFFLYWSVYVVLFRVPFL